ncbi:MAG: protease modulator HflC [Lachnospiraceae bacterium]|nr:protease modulator HflC [Lachnospiraceae bacterium]
MREAKKLVSLIVIVVVALIVFNLVTFTTKENEYAVVKQFGKIDRVVENPGLNVKIPFIQTVSKIPKNLQFYDLPQSDVITSDKKTMIVDAYIMWEVTDAKKFTQSLSANTSTAEGRIDVITYNAIKTTISNMTQEELIASRDDSIDVANADTELEDLDIKDIESEDEEKADEVEVINLSTKLLEHVGDQCDQYGIAIDNIEIKVLDLPEENKTAVYERMITERNNIAAAYTAQGQSEAQIIKNTTDKEVSVMLSKANADAEAIIGEGEAQYMSILSEAYNDEEKADFYLFVRELDAIRESLKNGQTTLFLDKDSPIAQIFQGVE